MSSRRLDAITPVSSAEAAISVRGLSKHYNIRHEEQRSTRITDAIASFARRPFRRSVVERFWALQNVSFDIRKGDVVGIVGRNGSGKSTLLKILSRITAPSQGTARMQGRVGSLLEVGTGFHPELTGRENIYLNGTVLGLRRSEITRQFDEIVEFAGVEKFLDTPVKRYSSGMYVRLAFAVAAHLDPEILIVDEVLAVGDAEFQKKCLGKMQEASQRQGRTVLFVSHNAVAVRSLCSSAIYLDAGRVVAIGPTAAILGQYHDALQRSARHTCIGERTDRSGGVKVRITDFYVTDPQGEVQSVMQAGRDYCLVMRYVVLDRGRPFHNVVGSIAVTDANQATVLLFRSNFTNENFTLKDGEGTLVCRVNDWNLAQGTYGVTLFLSHGEAEVLDLVDNASTIEVEGGDFFGTGSVGLGTHCKVLSRASWKVE